MPSIPSEMLNIQRQNWSAVVLGRWNRSILTPWWIGKTLLGVNEGEELHIQVPMDAIGPFRVTHDGLAIVVGEDRLIVEAMGNDFAGLGRAMKAVSKTMEELPRTPVTAVGLNISFSSTDDEVACIDQMWTSELDGELEQAGFPIEDRMAVRRLTWKSGHITFRLSQSTAEQAAPHHDCLFNFERRSDVMDDLKQWLQIPVGEIEQTVKRVRAMILARNRV
jgi:hypothetical protein